MREKIDEPGEKIPASGEKNAFSSAKRKHRRAAGIFDQQTEPKRVYASIQRSVSGLSLVERFFSG